MALTSIDQKQVPQGRVFALERAIKRDLSEHLVQLQVKHYLAGGLYVRALEIPAGVVLTGHIHKRKHIAMVIQGLIDVYDGDAPPKCLRAPCIFVSEPGIKRAGFAITDTVFVTVHKLDAAGETDIEKIEAECVCKTMEEYAAIAPETPEILERLETGDY